ncbi:hypothetical protein PENTCL1PPCAC_21511, partial [Pristionchus entomophagus]
MPLMHRGGKSLLLFLLISLMSSSTGEEGTATANYSKIHTTPIDRDYTTLTTDDNMNDQEMEGADSTSTSDDLIIITTSEPEKHACPEHFIQLTSDWCFHLRYDVEKQMNFQESSDYCSQRDAILPAITSVEVTTALMLERTANHISPMDVFYIGLGCNKHSRRWMWIGGPEYDPSEASFQRQFTSKEYCSRHEQYPFVFDQFGTWFESFDDPVPLIVCAVRPSGYSESTPIYAPCTEAWTPLPGGICYRLTENATYKYNITEAEQACQDAGGNLPTIRSSEQSEIIQAYLSGKLQSKSNFWIGLTCIGDGNDTMEDIGNRSWIDGTPYSEDFTNFLDEADNTPTCNLTTMDIFLYNAAIKGKWQKEHFDQRVKTLLCSRPDPEPNPTPSTKKTTRIVKHTTLITDDPFESTTESGPTVPRVRTTTPAETISSDSIEPGSTKDTTISTTSTEPTTTITSDKNRQLTKLELILIISLGTVIVIVLLIILIYFLCKRIRGEHVQEMVNSMQKRFSRSNTNAIVRQDEWEIRRQFVGIDYSRQLGRGAFGSVYLGRVYSGNIPEMAVKTLLQLNTLKKDDDFVAVKTLHDTADREAAADFMGEINIMKKIGFHERLVNILGCVTETEPLLLIVEYCSNGDLLEFMRERRTFMLKLKDTVGDSVAGRHLIITHRQQLMFGIQIAYGMEYLVQRGFVHRDIAARNILVDKNETCKIGDFGLCRKIEGESEQYISRGGRLPWRWMAPEALERYYFSVESDVWSFGVLLFEIITLGGNPYPDWPAVEV